MPNKLRKAPGKKTNGACWVNQHVLWIKYRSHSLPLFNISSSLSISALHLTNLLFCFFYACLPTYLCASRCSATTTSCIWSQWARLMQASMSARPSYRGLEWERLRLHSLSTVSYSSISLLLITVLIEAEIIQCVGQICLCSAKPCFCVKHGRWIWNHWDLNDVFVWSYMYLCLSEATEY